MATVSVILPNYNYGRYLKQRIESILNQDFTDFELIILDDASSDDSISIIESYRNHPKVSHIVINEENTGSPFKQWNKGIDLATGEYIWIAESDDFAEPSLLSRLLRPLRANPDTGLAYCQSWMVNDWKKKYPTARQYTDDLDPERWKSDYINNGADECMRYMLYKNTIPNASAVVFRKSIYLKAGRAPEDMVYMGDWLTWIRMLTISDIAFISEPLNYFRFHGRSVRHTNHFQPRFYTERFQVLAYLSTTFDIRKPDLQLVRDLILDDWMEQILGIGGQSEWKDIKVTLKIAQKIDSMISLRLIARCIALFIRRIFKGALPASPTDEQNKHALLQGLFTKYVQSLWRYLGQVHDQGNPMRIALCGHHSDLQNIFDCTHKITPAPIIDCVISDHPPQQNAQHIRTIKLNECDLHQLDAIVLCSRREHNDICQACYEKYSKEIKLIELYNQIPDVPF